MISADNEMWKKEGAEVHNFLFSFYSNSLFCFVTNNIAYNIIADTRSYERCSVFDRNSEFYVYAKNVYTFFMGGFLFDDLNNNCEYLMYQYMWAVIRCEMSLFSLMWHENFSNPR